jgi:copper chaperone CopZ
MWTQEVVKNLELKLAYKFTDVRTTYGGELLTKPLLPVHRGLATLFYVTPNQAWEFSATAQLVGSQRLPEVLGPTTGLPQYRIDRRSPVYPLFNAQVTWRLKNGLEWYLGGENLGNYRQSDPIIGASEPFGTDPARPQFDATSVFGPIMGTMAYVGMRYTLKSWAALKEVRIQTSAKCEMCKDVIEKGLLDLEGVESAELAMNDKVATIRYNPKKVSVAQLRDRISAVGYHADDVPRDDAAYQKLPACCK